jgi:hypothetical protein
VSRSINTVISDMERQRFDALHASVVLDLLAPRSGCTWRPVCCLCIDSLDVASEAEIEARRINKHTGHDTGCCSFCGAGGRDTLVAAIPDIIFDEPPASYLDSRRGYADGGGAMAVSL